MPDLIDNALEEMENITESETSGDISNILEVLKDYEVNTLINREMPVEILPKNRTEQLIQTAPKLKSGKFVEKDVKFLAKILKIINFFLNKSISDDNFTFLSTISTIFYYLQIPPELLRRIVSKDKFSKINENTFDFFKKLDVSFNVPKMAPDFDKESFRRYKTGLAKDDINSVYYFVESAERGMYVYPKFFVAFLARILVIEPSKYFDFLESTKEPFMLVEYINIIETKLDKEFLRLLQSSSNKWLLFEYLRQIFKDLNSEATLKEEEITLISFLLGKLYTISDAKFFTTGIKFLTKFKNKKYLGICVGTFLSDLNDKHLIESLVEVMGINERAFNLEFWTCTAKTLEKENEELLELVGQIIFNKWNNFFKELFTDEKFIMGIIYTDYINIVVFYFQECLSKDKSKFLKLLGEKLDSIINYKSFWIKYPSRKRLISLSYVYYMSEAWKNVLNSEIEVETLKKKILFILNDERMFLSLPDYEGSHKRILKIKNNFGLVD